MTSALAALPVAAAPIGHPGHWRTLTPEQLLWVENRCRPGDAPDHVCSAGMLAPTETLREVLERDEATLARTGITAAQIADVLEAAAESAKDIWHTKPNTGTFTLDGRKHLVEVTEYMGCQESPFREGEYPPHSSANITVTNPEGRRFQFGGALPHLIRTHEFFEGHAQTQTYKRDGITCYRVDPEEAIQYFGIQPGREYSPELATAKAIPRRLLADPYNFFKINQGCANLRYSA